eukprot:symbB.v1.2.024015.t1/scaffold2154.1/size87782/2
MVASTDKLLEEEDGPCGTYCSELLHHTSVVFTDEGGASVSTSTLNLVLSTIGVGALTLPYTTATIGYGQSLVLLLTFFLVSVYNLYLLDFICRSPNCSGAKSYAAVVSAVLGQTGAYGLEAFMLLYSFGLSVSYMGVIGSEVNVLAQLMGGDEAISQADLITLVAILVVLPLSLLPDALLRMSGAVGTVCMILTTAIVVCMVPWTSEVPYVRACADATTRGPLSLVAWRSSPVALLAAVPMFSFCMNAATAFVSIRSEMGSSYQEPPRTSIVALIWLAQSFALLDYLVSGAAGYVSFCQGAPDNVLDGFPLTHWPSLLARFAIALQLTCACSGVYIPLARAALTHLIIGLTSGAPQGLGRVISTASLVSLMVLVARLLDGALALPLGLTSAVCTTAIMFVFPGLCAYCLNGGKTPLAFAACGLVIGTASTVTLLIA